MSVEAIYRCNICNKDFWKWDSREDPEGLLAKPRKSFIKKQGTVNNTIFFTLSWELDICDNCLGYYLRQFLIKLLKEVHSDSRYNLDKTEWNKNAIQRINNEIISVIEEIERDLQ